MTHFKLNQFKINAESKNSEIKISEADSFEKMEITEFNSPSVQPHSNLEYSSVKSKYGSLATTDLERNFKSQKDSRFKLNPLLRGCLSVEQEERRAIDERIHSRVESLAENAKIRSIQVGYQEGLKNGYDEAYHKTSLACIPVLERLDSLIQEVENAKLEIFHANEKFLIDLIFKISRMVLLKELSIDRDFLLRLSNELVNHVDAKDHIQIKIGIDSQKDNQSKEDLSQDSVILKERLESNYSRFSNIKIELSDQIPKGSCKIETDLNYVDTNIDMQLENIYETLMTNQ